MQYWVEVLREIVTQPGSHVFTRICGWKWRMTLNEIRQQSLLAGILARLSDDVDLPEWPWGEDSPVPITETVEAEAARREIEEMSAAERQTYVERLQAVSAFAN